MGAELLPDEAMWAVDLLHRAGDPQSTAKAKGPADEARCASVVGLEVLRSGGARPPAERFHRCQLVLPLDVPVEVGHVVEHEIGTGRREDSLLPGVRSELIDLDNH